MEWQRYWPAGKTTVPPPAAAAASMALLTAGVSRVLPSPTAPNARGLKLSAGVFAALTAAEWAAGTAARAAADAVKKVRRRGSMPPIEACGGALCHTAVR